MATDKEIDQIERRAELAVKVATLEERSLTNQTQLTKIEDMLVKHSTDEEQMLKDINGSLIKFKEEIDEKFEEELTPIKKTLSDYNSFIKYTMFIGSSLVGLALAFKDQIIAWFHN